MPDFRIPTGLIDWLNVETYRRVRRVDIITGVFGVVSVAWGWYSAGWRGAVIGALGFLLILMYALWTRPFEEDD